MDSPHAGQVARILAALPQTQCTRCGYADCAGYAQAVADGAADINQCPPGGAQGVTELARLTGQAPVPLNPAFGAEAPRTTMFIDEDWCIGCTLCIAACPTDAIMGSNKRMHTVMEAYCTGCELCLPVCPVDCIVVENASGQATGWDAWTPAQAQLASARYESRQNRHKRERITHDAHQAQLAHTKLSDLATHSRITNPQVLEKKRAIIEAALKRARSKHDSGGKQN